MDNLTVKEGTDHSKQNSINTKRFKNLPKQDSKLDHSKSSSIEDLVPKEIKEELYNQRYEVLRGLLEKIKINELEITEEDLKDPFCDPANPKRVSFNDISAAAYRIKGGIEYTPCTVSCIL